MTVKEKKDLFVLYHYIVHMNFNKAYYQIL